ncbi:hypothetical protein lerEdw1_009440 [Lerista edwardsae]|nr:hypothetical protein lerEdw1_009440 [Lerista edwardsae]
MRNRTCWENTMDLESGPAATLGWSESLPLVKCRHVEEEASGSSMFESGYLSLKGTAPEERDTPAEPEPPWSASEQDHLEMQVKVDFFRKLGYSSEEILGVLQKHGLNADTNTVLGELVKHGMAVVEKEPAEAPQEARETPLLPRGGAANQSPPPAVPSEGKEGENLRPIVIDGSNVAMSHGDKDVFSCRGILLAVNWFLDRGHKDITVFVPAWRKEQPRPDVPIADQHILRDLEKKKILVFTPSRRVGGKRVACYDDRFIVKLAHESDGIVVSNDEYRDLQKERPEWKKFIDERLLMYSFVNDRFMPPDDPLGRHGPSLENFLRKKPMVPEHKKQQCPYGKKCTYGIKCKFYHPERLNQTQRSLADELRANARLSPTRSAPAVKEERLGRRPTPAEFLGSVPTDGDKPSLQKASEKKSSAPKAKHGDKPPVLLQGLGGPPSSSYRPSEWYPPHPMSSRMDSLSYVSQDRLDSGIGSLESQFSEMWPGPGVGVGKHSHPEHLAVSGYRGQRAVYQPSAGPESNSYSHYQARGYRKPASGANFVPYDPNLSSGRPPHSFSGYSLPAEASASLGPGQKYWSEPYQPSPAGCRDLPRAPQVAYGDSCQWAPPDRFAEERANVHVKLCGIFHPHLVDAVMSRFPRLLDPQQLAAEILTYKNQNPGV